MSEPGRVIAFPDRFDTSGQRWQPWVTEQAVAAFFSTTTRTVRRWRQAGCPSRMFGGARRYRISDVEAWHAS